MKVLFVVNDLGYIDPIGIAHLSSVAKERGCHTFFCSLDRDNLSKKVRLIQPQIIAYSANSCTVYNIIKEHAKIRSFFNGLSIIGGPHPTFCPDDVLNQGFNACAIGEGDATFGEFLDCVKANKPYDDVEGLITTREKAFMIRPLIEDLDSLPFPDRDLVLSNTALGETSKKTFFTGRGCPFRCTYCLNPSLQNLYEGKGKYARRFSVRRVLDEIVYVKKRYRLDFVKFDDDVFAIKPDSWLEKFSREYKRKINIPFNCLLRLDCANEELLKLLRSAGCHSITTSVDSASNYVRSKVLVRNMTNKTIIDTLKRIDSHGIKTFVNYIVELPHATIEDELESISIGSKTRTTYNNYTFLVPFPGTHIWKYCRENKFIDNDYIVPKNLFEEPTLNFSKKEKRIHKNILQLGQVAKMAPPGLKWCVILIIRHFPNLNIFNKIKQKVHSYYMRNVIYKCRDNVLL